jgi:hypothetical protein
MKTIAGMNKYFFTFIHLPDYWELTIKLEKTRAKLCSFFKWTTTFKTLVGGMHLLQNITVASRNCIQPFRHYFAIKTL